ncbi:MAG: DUF58 domain-containing protein [Arcobacter sp.]|nr:MAG: DUF58 domain-containing protein [Arcobacter sp.]
MNKNIHKLLIKTKKAVFSQKIGNNTSKIKGEGYDFVELREYEDGEDIRKIDWIISAKLQKPYVKVFYTQRELEINIIPILTGSTYFGTTKLKKDLITEICSILGYIATAQGDSYRSFIANETSILNTKQTKQIHGVQRMVEKINSYDPIAKIANYENITQTLNKQIRKKSLLFLIGDFFNCDNLNLKILSKKHEVVVIIIRDKFEEAPKPLGSVNFIDPSTSGVFEGDLNKSLVDNYKQKVKKNDYKLYEQLKQSGIEFTKIYTHNNPIRELAKLFKN